MNADDEKVKKEGKMELISITSELMPKGVPNLTGVIKYPTIKRLGQEIGKKGTLLMILALVRDYCNSINVVRNMNQDQMLETASMLLDECDNFRLEDYVIMFSMAKRGEFVKVYDHVDINLVSEIMDGYWLIRNEAGKRAHDEEFKDYEDKLKEINRTPAVLTPEEERRFEDISGQMKELSKKMTSYIHAEADKEYERRDQRIAKLKEMYWGKLTPEQQQEISEQKTIALENMKIRRQQALDNDKQQS